MVFFSSYPKYIAEPAPNKGWLIPHGHKEKKIVRDGHTVVKLPLEQGRQERNIIRDEGSFVPKSAFIS